MSIQWHPFFAALLRPLVEGYYDVETNVPVGDAPREADIVVVRRTGRRTPPFRGLWRHLHVLNIIEFKGPSVSPRLADLDLLVELGLGIHRWHNGQAVKSKQSPVASHDVALWYLVKHVGRRFRQEAARRLGSLTEHGHGVWQATVLDRAIYFVGGSDLPVEVESTPFHLLDVSASEKGWATAEMMRQQPELLAAYIPFLGKVPMKLLQELEAMARKKMKGPDLRIGPIAELIGLKNVIDELGLKRIIDEAGAKRVVNELGAEKVVNELGAERFIDIAFRHLSEVERADLKRRVKSKPR